MAIDLNRYRTLIGKLGGIAGNYMSEALLEIENGINQLGKTIGVSPNDTVSAPPPVQSLTVKTDGNGNVHAVVSDNNEINKNLHYFVEMATNSGFFKSHVFFLGPSRTLPPMPLAANDDNGNPQSFYFRAFSQYMGGMPGPKVNYGGNTPTAVAPGGTAKMTFLPSTGSGTGQNTGEQSGVGFGVDQVRQQQGTVKRQS